MTLTNEEKKKIADAAAQMMQTFCEFKLAEDRLATMNNLSGHLINMSLDDKTMQATILPYFGQFKKKQEEFFSLMGIQEDNKEFWEYSQKVDKEKLRNSKTA